ncbi:MAG: N-acetylmuramoyl-L-alanine amidase [Bacteroidia bacterium]|nr:N-acetylmuramoyl-L-alanine amidase [Bacteroidia bacterium]
MESKLTKFYLFDRNITGLLFLLFLLSGSRAVPAPPQKSFGVKTVVIDAGHGGHDSGCLGSKYKEKDVALGIALQLGEQIEKNFPDVNVIYTRKTDVFVELHERASIANNARADLFICIHCNSACYFDKKKRKNVCNSDTHGVETWVMGLHVSEANLEVSKRENEVVLLEKDYLKQYDGFDPNSPEANIIFSLYQNTYLDQSLKLATNVQQEMKKSDRLSRGVKQAGFLVLYKTSMPSILIETGFLSNPEEEKYLGSQKGQKEMATSIFRAFRDYKTDVENAVTKAEHIPEKSAGKNRNDIQEAGPVNYSVQFYLSAEQLKSDNPRLKHVQDIRTEKSGSMYKYLTGNFPDIGTAIQRQEELRTMGFQDAFLVAYSNGIRISLKEARELQQKK